MAYGHGQERLCYTTFSKSDHPFQISDFLSSLRVDDRMPSTFSSISHSSTRVSMLTTFQQYQGYGGLVGTHGLYIVGYASISYRDIEQKDDCGEDLPVIFLANHVVSDIP